MRKLFVAIGICAALNAWGQEGERDAQKALDDSREYTRQANRDLSDNDFVDAEGNYRRAISKSDQNAVAPYNLGNAYYQKESYGEAFGQYKAAGERAGEKPQKHKAYHNMGNVYMKRKEYQQAVDAYKEALRNNPADEETRYNLALAKELLKKDQENQQNQDQQDQEDQEQEQEQEQENQDNSDQEGENEDQQDQQGDSDEKEDNQEGEGENKQEQDRKPEDQQQQQEQPRPTQLSPQQIQNLLQAMENEEKKVKEKIDAQKVKGTPARTEKDW